MNRINRLLLLLAFPILITSCETMSDLSLEESDEDVSETIANLGKKIEEHRRLKKSVETKESLVSDADVEIMENEELVRKQIDEINQDFNKFKIERGLPCVNSNLPKTTKKYLVICDNCNWSGILSESNFHELINKLKHEYHEHVIIRQLCDISGKRIFHKEAFGRFFKEGLVFTPRIGVNTIQANLAGCCLTCRALRILEPYEDKIKTKKKEVNKIKSELEEDKPKLKKSSEYIEERKSSHSLIREQRARKRALKQEINKEIEEKLKAQKQAAEKELENAQLRKEKEQQTRRIEELKKQLSEQNLNTARVMLKSNIPIAMIISVIGLSRKEIKGLL